MWQELLKMGVQIGGNALLPGAGSLGAGVLDATLPAEQPTSQTGQPPIDPNAQKDGGIGVEKLIEVGLGQAPAQLYNALFAPKQQVMGRSFNKNQSWAQGG